MNCSHCVGVILLCVYKSVSFQLYGMSRVVVQSVLVGIIRVTVSCGLRPQGNITDVRLG